MAEEKPLEDKVDIGIEFTVRHSGSEKYKSNSEAYWVAVRKGINWEKFIEESGVEGEDKQRTCNAIMFKYDTGEGLFSNIYVGIYVSPKLEIRNKIRGIQGIYILDLIAENSDQAMKEVDNILKRYNPRAEEE